MAQQNATLQTKTNKGSSHSLPSTTGKASKSVLDRKPTPKVASLPEKRIVRASDLQTQLSHVNDKLKKVKEEKAKVVKELQEVKKSLSIGNAKNQVLEEDVKRTTTSERNMLESMVSQTKLLEEAKMELEETKMELKEVKLEVETLQDAIQNMDSSRGRKSKNISRRQLEDKLVNAEEEIKQLRIQLKCASETEEKSESTMGDLTRALSEMVTEANQMKTKFLQSETELASLKTQANSTKSILRITQEKLQTALNESNISKLQSEELSSLWNKKESELTSLVSLSEEQISLMKKENSALIESQNVLRNEISNLQDKLRKSENERNILNEELDKARIENSQLKHHTFLEKDNVLTTPDQEYFNPEIFLTKGHDEGRIETSELRTSSYTSMSICKESGKSNNLRSSRTEKLRIKDVTFENNSKESDADCRCLEDSNFTMVDSSEQENDKMFASISSASDHDDGLISNADGFHHVDESQLSDMQNVHISGGKTQSKKPIFQKLGVMFKGKRLHN